MVGWAMAIKPASTHTLPVQHMIPCMLGKNDPEFQSSPMRGLLRAYHFVGYSSQAQQFRKEVSL